MPRTERYAHHLSRDDRKLIAKALTAYKKGLKAQTKGDAVDLEEHNEAEMAAADEIARLMELEPEYYQPEKKQPKKDLTGTAEKETQDTPQHTAEQLCHRTYGQIPAEYRRFVRITVRPAQRKSTKYLITFKIQGMNDKKLYIPYDKVSYKRAAANIVPALYLASSTKQRGNNPRTGNANTRPTLRTHPSRKKEEK